MNVLHYSCYFVIVLSSLRVWNGILGNAGESLNISMLLVVNSMYTVFAKLPKRVCFDPHLTKCSWSLPD